MVKRKKQQRRGKIITMLLVFSMVMTCFPTVSKAASTDSPEQQFRQLYLELLESGDSSQQDITDLNLPYMTCYNIMQEVKQNEGFVAYQCYIGYNLLEPDEIVNDGGQQRLLKFHMSQSDEGFQQRYAQVKKIIEQVQKNLDDKMTDLDKLLWIHEYVVEHIYYNNTNEVSGHLGGTTFVQGYGVCEGYARAMMLFLKAENIPCKTVDGGAHEWVAVEIDGEWYHVDPTWDDTCSGSVGTHYFLLRNDDEFINTLTRKHDQWTAGSAIEQSTNTISTSTEYADWYVHNVWNKMYYYEGYWYYILDNAVRKNNIQGTNESVIYEGKNLTISGLEEGILEISSSMGKSQLDLSENAVTEAPTKVVTPTATVTSPATIPPTATVPPITTIPPTATVTPVTTILPTATIPPVITIPPTVTVAPTATVPPTATVSPTVMVTPVTTTPPTATVTPITTISPTATVTPITTIPPTATITSTVTVPLVATTIPTATVTTVPTITEKPTVTVKPTVALTPNTTKKIKVGKPVIKSVTNKKGKKVKVVLKKKVSGASGYEIKYSTDKKFKKSVKTVRFTGTSKTINKLRKNKTYYVKVRGYKKNSNGNRSYGPYSSVKKVKIKK